MNTEAPTESPAQAETVDVVEPVESKTTTALAVVTKSIAEFNTIAAVVASLEHEYKGVVYDVKTTAGMDAASKARVAIRKPRYTIQNMQKEAKRTLNALKEEVDDQAEVIISRITAIEDPIHEQIVNEEARKETERKAKAEAERLRVEAIEARITAIRDSITEVAGMAAAVIQAKVVEVEAIVVDDTFGEFRQRAEGAKAATLIRLKAAHSTAEQTEAEAVRLANERAELARQREAEEVRQAAERARIAEEQRQAQVALDAETTRRNEQLRVQREENDRIEARRKAERDAEDARLAAAKAEADRVEAARRETAVAEEKRLAEQRAEIERQQAKLREDQERAAAPPPVVPEPTKIEAPQPPAIVERAPATVSAINRPSDDDIIHVIAESFFVPESTAVEWLLAMDLRQDKRSAA